MGMGNREKKKEVCGCGSGREEVEEGGGMRDGGKKLVRTSDGGEGRPVDRRHRTQAMGEEGVGEREREGVKESALGLCFDG